MLLQNSSRFIAIITLSILLAGCVSVPTLSQTARKRQTPNHDKNSITGDYKITDRDVLDYTDQLKRRFSARFDRDRSARYGSSTAQLTLGALAGSVKTFGWSAGTAGALGTAATYVFGLGQIFDAKGHGEAYEHAFAEIEKAEANYFFYRLGLRFAKDEQGKVHVDRTGYQPRGDIPSSEVLTDDGEALYYRVTKIVTVLDDAIAGKIPNLQDLKDATGDKSTSSAPPPAK